MFGIDKGCDAPGFLAFGYRMKGKGGFSGGFRTVDLDHPTTGISAHAQGQIQSDGTG